MRFTRAALLVAGGLTAACTEHVPTSPRGDVPAVPMLSAARADRHAISPNEPTGYTMITDRGFATIGTRAGDASGAEGWDASESQSTALAVAADATAPHSAPSVLLLNFSRGARNGVVRSNLKKTLTATTRQFFVSLWLKLSPAWQGEAELAQVVMSGQPRLGLRLSANESGEPSLAVTLADAPDRRHVLAIGPDQKLSRGQWHRIEFLGKSSAPNGHDGLVKVWLDGAPALAVSDLRVVRARESDTWQAVQIASTWTASTQQVQQPMQMSLDHVYVSGSASTTMPVTGAATSAALAVDQTIFSDDFESGTLAQWQDGVDPTKHHVLTDSSLAHSGTHVLEMTYPAGQGGGWLTRFFMPGYDSLYVSYWVRFDANWSGSTALLGLRGSRTDNQWSAFGKAGVCPSGSDFFAATIETGSSSSPLDLSFDTYFPGMVPTSGSTNCWGRDQTGGATYFAGRTMTVGTWHHVETWVKLNTIAQNDALQRMWLDGRLVGEWSGLPLRADTALRLNSVMLDGSAIAPQTQHVYVDDIVVLPTMPATATPVASVAITLNSPTLLVGQSTQAVAVLRDASGATLTNRNIAWSSSNSAIATVDATGLVSAIAAGVATITATSEGVVGSAQITVAPPPVATVSVTLNAPSLTVGQSTQSVATLLDATGNVLTGRAITWSSSNPAVATVNASGLATAISAGTTTISATSEGVSGGASLAVVASPPADNAVFSEGFESGSLAAWQDGVNPAKHQVLNDATLAHSGTHVLQMTYPAGQDGGWLTRFFMPGYDSLYVGYWVRLEPTWTGSTALIDLRGSRTDNQWSSFGKATVCPSGSDFFTTSISTGALGGPLDLSFFTYYPGMPKQPNGSCAGQTQGIGTTTYAVDRTLSTGVWHHIEYWVKLNTIGRNDAVQRMWLDGVLKGDWSGFPLRTDAILKLNALLLDGAATAPQTEHLYVDDIEVRTTNPYGDAAPPPPPPPPPAPVASVSVTLNSPSLAPTQGTQAVATLRDANGNVLTGRAISWSSSNQAVGTVDANGFVTANAAGSTVISATSEGVQGSATLTVVAPPAPVASVTVTLNASSLTVGQSTQAVAVLKDASGTVLSGRVISWASSNTAVATVNASGLVTAVAAGSAAITANSEGIAGQASLSVTATPPPPPAPVASVTVTLNASSLTVGQSTQAVALLKDASGTVLTGRTISWTSSSTAVATVNASGVVSAVGAGTASITATSEGVQGSSPLTVTPVPVASVTVTLGASSLTVGQTTQATAVVKDANGTVLTGRSVTWASGNGSIATVSNTGLVTAVAVGSTPITATSGGVTGQGTVTVAAAPPPPPPPPPSGEPIYAAGTNRELFYDGFEAFTSSADLLTWQSHAPGRWTYDALAPGNVTLTTTGAAVGSKAVRFSYPAGTSQQDLLIESLQGQSGSASVVVVTWWMRTQPGYVWNNSAAGQGGQGHKLFVGNIGGVQNSPANRILLQQDVAGILPAALASCYNSFQFVSSPTWSIGNVLLKQNMNLASWRVDVQGNDGTWQRWTTRFTQSPDPITNESGHGRIEMWVNGVQIMKYLGDDPTRCEYGMVNVPNAALGDLFPNLHFPSVNGSVGGQWLEYDDIRIWTP